MIASYERLPNRIGEDDKQSRVQQQRLSCIPVHIAIDVNRIDVANHRPRRVSYHTRHNLPPHY